MKLLKRIFLLLILTAVTAGLAVTFLGWRKYKQALEETPLETAVATLRAKENYTIYADIPEIYIQAIVATEDRRFYQHNGFDPVGIGRAIITDIQARALVEGGSTISQQLAKNMYFPQDNTLSRKIAEIFMALQIERQYKKEDVLELYVNGIYYGSGYYCIYDAAMGYFNKPPAKLSDYECTLLAGIPNAPSVYSLDVNPDLAHQRQEKVVESMIACNYLDIQTAAAILAAAGE